MIIVLAAALSSCGDDDEAGRPVTPTLAALPPLPPYPIDNQPDPNRFVLGWRLFYDPILSGSKDVACGTCHHAAYNMSDGRDVSLGVLGTGLGPERAPTTGFDARVRRNSISVVNSAYLRDQFWDGRAASLEAQALVPLASEKEMRSNAYLETDAVDSVIARLRKIGLYERDFKKAFPERADSIAKGLAVSAITRSTLARAIASFERELTASNSKFDAYMRGEASLLPDEEEGLKLFTGKAGCVSCHSGPLLSDELYYCQGIGNPREDDPGRFLVTHASTDRYAFRTPPLRNVAKTAPYMHSGVLGTLREVIEYYTAARLHDTRQDGLTPASFVPLGLTVKEQDQLEDFLLTLTDESWLPFADPPASVYSGLPVPH